MLYQRLLKCNKKFYRCLWVSCLWLFPITLHASIIESTIGAAVVNDATATYYNPAALTLLKNRQLIGLGSASNYHTHFNGQALQPATQYSQSGSANSNTHYYLPSLYLGIPTAHNMTFGFAVIYNYFYRDIADDSILRYVHPNNRIQDINFVPAVGININEFFAIGAGFDITHVNILSEPVSGFPSLGIKDAQSHNETGATSWGGQVGFLLKPTKSTTVGFNYRSAITYQMKGKSSYEGAIPISSDDYHFKFWTPARSVLSINHFVTPTLGFISTVQYIQWKIFDDRDIHNIATRFISQPVILPSIESASNLRNTWLFTIGSHYRVTPKWIMRVAGSINQSANSGRYQISGGDNYIVAASTGYEVNKYFTVDCGYAHAFIDNQSIDIATSRNVITGDNQGSRDIVSLKLTLNI